MRHQFTKLIPSTAFTRFGLLVVMSAAAGTPALAQDASPWISDTHSQVRLIAGTNPAGASPVRAGIEIKLAPGWLTYWRYAGDAGVPPQFNFAGSQNVAGVTVLWPAPQRFEEAGAATIGYQDHVVLPLRVRPKDANRPVVLALKLNYAICERVCIPARADAQLRLTDAISTHDGLLSAAASRVPKPASVGGKGPLAVLSVHRQAGKPSPRVVVVMTAPRHTPVNLFAEGPTPDWALPVPPTLPPAETEHRRISFALDGAPPGAKTDGAVLTLTEVAGSKAITVKTPLD